MMKLINLLFLTFLLLTACSKPEGFYDKETRQKIRSYEPNILFTSFHVLECDKYVLLKNEAGHPLTTAGEDSAVIDVNFLTRAALKIKGSEYNIKSDKETVALNQTFDEVSREPLTFEINNTAFQFVEISPVRVMNREELKEIKAGTKIYWEKGNPDEKILFAIKPGAAYCGKKGARGQVYGTRPVLVPDIGVYEIKAEDLRNFDPEMEAAILLKRGKNKIAEIINDEGNKEQLCISTIAYINIPIKIK